MAAHGKVAVTREAGDAQEFVLRVDGARLGSLDYALPEAGWAPRWAAVSTPSAAPPWATPSMPS